MTRIVDLPLWIGSPEVADVIADRLGDVTDDVLVLNYGCVAKGGPRFAERLLRRLLVEGGARRIDVAGAEPEPWQLMLDAATKLGVADRIDFRLIGRVFNVAYGAP